MRRAFRTLLLTALPLALLATATVAAETYQLALKFRPGQILRFAIDQTALMDIEVPGQTAKKIRLTNKAVLKQQVSAVSSDGTAELLCLFESWETAAWLDGTEIPAARDQAAAVLAARIKLRVGPQGKVEVLDPVSLPNGIDLDTLANYGFLRTAPVAVGQGWTTSGTRTVDGFPCRVVLDNRLERVDAVNGSRIAQISQDLRLEIPESPVPLGESIYGKMTAGGSILGVSTLSFNLNTGIVEKQMSIVNGKLLAKLQTGAARLEMPLSIDVTSVVALLN